ncbi:MAG: DUF6691 family protein [Bacteroidota bacterium]
MRNLYFFIVGIAFGIIMIKSEAASWFRIFEMFNFQSFHMYGIISSAIAFGLIGNYLIKSFKLKDLNNNSIEYSPKENTLKRYIIGGSIFGLGWALVGACPGPMFVLFGAGFYSIILVIISALIGTLIYGVLKDKLPH